MLLSWSQDLLAHLEQLLYIPSTSVSPPVQAGAIECTKVWINSEGLCDLTFLLW